MEPVPQPAPVAGRRPLLVGLGIFTAASLVCAVTPSATMLVAVRAIQGLAGAAGIAIANAGVTDHFRGRDAVRFLSRLALVSGMAPIVAPLGDPGPRNPHRGQHVERLGRLAEQRRLCGRQTPAEELPAQYVRYVA